MELSCKLSLEQFERIFRQKNKKPFVEYSLVLTDFGGDAETGRRAYQKRIKEDLSGELDIRTLLSKMREMF
jgi:hypothetical protein